MRQARATDSRNTVNNQPLEPPPLTESLVPISVVLVDSGIAFTEAGKAASSDTSGRTTTPVASDTVTAFAETGKAV